MTSTALRRSADGPARRHENAGVLPAVPDDREKVSYLERHRLYLGVALVTGNAAMLACQVGFEIFDSPWLIPLTILLIMHMAASLSVMFAGQDFSYSDHRRLMRSWQPRSYPDVDIYLPIAGEPVAVLRNTWIAVFELVRAYPGTARPYVLDDGASPEARMLADSFGFGYVIRADFGRMRKAGNLRYAFARTRGRFIVIFDADFAPRRDFLSETLPYFDDERTGIIQTPQYFRTDPRQTWVERAGNAVQEVFYRNIQPARDHLGATVCCGTCAVYRRAALEPDGGFAEVPYAEDEHTGLNVRRHGYAVRYLPVVLAAGMSPGTIDGFVRQQYRWCSGTFSTLRRWPAGIGLRGRLCYATGFFYYLYSAAMVVAGPLVPIVLLAWFPAHIHLQNYLIFAPVMISGMVLYPIWHRCDFGPATWPLAVIRGWSHLLALCDFVTGRTMQWQPTGASISPVRRLWIGLIIWNGGTAIAWLALAIQRSAEYHSDRFAIVGALGLLYACIIAWLLMPVGKEGPG